MATNTKTVIRYRNRAGKKVKRRAKKMTLPIAVVVPLGLLTYNTAQRGISQGPEAAMGYMMGSLTGYSISDRNWKVNRLYNGLFPILMGGFIHKGANRLGINRALSSAGVPWLRL